MLTCKRGIPVGDLADFAAISADLDEARRVARTLSGQLTREKARTAALVDAVMTAAKTSAISQGRGEVVAPKRDQRKNGAEIALVHTTDWQTGKGTADYSSVVTEARIAKLADKVRSLTSIQRADHPVKECVVLLGGDMIEGVSIFPGQAFEVELTLYDQLFAAARIIESFVLSMLSEFESVSVWDIHGNHGRIGRKGDIPATDNMDRIAYRIAMDRMVSQRRLTWNHASSWHQIVEVGAYRALLVHGDQIKSFGGNLPAYGIIRKTSAWKAGVLPPFRDSYVGHFHTHQDLNLAGGGMVYMTGSPESANEYAREFIAATGTPSQRLHFIDPRRGRVTAQYRVDLDD